MTVIDDHGRPEPPEAADELDTLLGFLDYQRATFAWKCSGLDSAGMRARVGPSTMTLGGMMKHLAVVEEGWFRHCLFDRPFGPPWDAVDFDSDPDWEWRTAADDSPEELFALWNKAVDDSRLAITEALKQGGLDQLARRVQADGRSPSLRWIICHMTEEYARHNGHADLLRESVDGTTGE
jgi:uncharacterized damage-inducible protein DinB